MVREDGIFKIEDFGNLREKAEEEIKNSKEAFEDAKNASAHTERASLTLVGTVGNSPVRMSVTVSGQTGDGVKEYTGGYSYTKIDNWLYLKGFGSESDLSLVETNPEGRETGTFSLTELPDGTGYSGKFINLLNGREFAVTLHFE